MTLVIKAREDAVDDSTLKPAAKAINDGGVVVFPTETVYGIGADAFNPRAVRRIFEIKKRPADNPLIVHIAKLEDLEELVKTIPHEARKLIDAFWPGPLTLILPKKDTVPDEVTAGLPTVAVRMPAHRVALKLIELSGTPIAAPSANPAGKPSGTEGRHVIEDFYGKVDVIIDGGRTSLGLESTVLDLTGEKPRIVRPGFITKEDIESVLGKELETYVPKKNEKPISPGMKYRHYAPDAEMFVITGDEREKLEKMKNAAERMLKDGKRVGLILFRDDIPAELAHLDRVENCVMKICSSDERLAASKLFLTLREFDERNVDIILAEEKEEKGLWLAIMNRVRKAAGGKVL